MEKIAFWGNFGTGNLGNECTLQAAVANTRRRFPQARLVCICTGPEDVSSRHDLECFSIQPPLADPGFGNAVPPAKRLLRKLLFAVPNELRRCWQAFSVLEGIDALVVPGTQVLAKYDSEIFGWTYFALKWSGNCKTQGFFTHLSKRGRRACSWANREILRKGRIVTRGLSRLSRP